MAKYKLDQDFTSSNNAVIKKNNEVGYNRNTQSPSQNNLVHCKYNENNQMPWRTLAFASAQLIFNYLRAFKWMSGLRLKADDFIMSSQ